MKIAVFGLGYIGSVSAGAFASLGNRVVGVELVEEKVNIINSGKGTVKEKGLDRLIGEQVKAGRLWATTNVKKAIESSDIAFVCVGTPPKRNGDIDLSALKSVCKQLGKEIKEKKEYIIVIRSTMFPGSLDILKKIIEKTSEKKEGKDFHLAVNPEFLREGSAIKDFFEPPFIVIGGESKEVCKKAMACYGNIKTKKFIVKTNIGQMIKYASNSFHALKVVFANEIGAVCEKAGVDGKKLMSLFCEDNQLNISPYYLKPGFAYGGSCLPKDVAALKNNAKRFGIKTPILDGISLSNMQQIKRAINLIERRKKKNIGILGLTFKADTDDIRGNPILFVINNLISKGYKIKIYDKLIDKNNLDSISKSYRKEVFDLINMENLKEKVNGIKHLFSDLGSVLKQEVIVISNRDKSLVEYLSKLTKKQKVIDLQNIFNQYSTSAEYTTL